MPFYQKNCNGWKKVSEPIVRATLMKFYDFLSPHLMAMIIDGEVIDTPDGDFKWVDELPQSNLHPVFDEIFQNFIPTVCPKLQRSKGWKVKCQGINQVSHTKGNAYAHKDGRNEVG